MSDAAASWPRRTRMPDLATLDEPLHQTVLEMAARLRAARTEFGDRFLATARESIGEYRLYSDEEIRESAIGFVDIMADELESYRIPDDALRETLVGFAHDRVSRGMSLEALAISYQLGSRDMLTLMDRIAAEVALPPELLLAVHDSTWEFANEAAAIFASVRHDLAVQRARFDAERRSAFTRGVLGGSLTAEQIHRDADGFGLDSRVAHRAVAVANDGSGGEAQRREIAHGLRMRADSLLFAEFGSSFGCIVTHPPDDVAGQLIAVSRPLPLDRLQLGFEEAEIALQTGLKFALCGVVQLAELGPRPLVLGAQLTADGLEDRHCGRLDTEGRSGQIVEETARIYLELDQSVPGVAEQLTVHPNTVRYRVNKFQELTGLDLHRTEDLVTAWLLLNRRRGRRIQAVPR